MKIEELNARLQKCNETIEKKQNLIVKRNKTIEKKMNELRSLGFKGNTSDELHKELQIARQEDFKGEKFQTGYDVLFDLDEAYSSIKSATRAIEEEKAKIEKYKEMMKKEEGRNDIIENLPSNVIEFMNNIEESWNGYDKSRRNKCETMYNELKNLDKNSQEYKDLYYKMRNMFGAQYQWYMLMERSDRAIEEENTKAVKSLIVDFINRVKEKVGTISSMFGLRVSQNNQGYAIINGYVEGTEGKCRVESILAGGYNIQRLHVRVLVK